MGCSHLVRALVSVADLENCGRHPSACQGVIRTRPTVDRERRTKLAANLRHGSRLYGSVALSTGSTAQKSSVRLAPEMVDQIDALADRTMVATRDVPQPSGGQGQARPTMPSVSESAEATLML
jgi:hypothetical protein